MNNPSWLHGYAATPDGKPVRSQIRALQQVDLSDLPDTAWSYRDRWEALQEALDAGTRIDPQGVTVVSRTLVDDAQADSVASGRVDLRDSLVALTGLPGGAGDFFHELLSPNPDRTLLRKLSAPFHGSIRFEESSMQSEATLHFEGGGHWPESLGGPWQHERARSITVNCRYAKWRDRRVRRLGRVRVAARDIVPAL